MIELAVIALDVSVVVADPLNVTNPTAAVVGADALIRTWLATPLSARLPAVVASPVPAVNVPEIVGDVASDGAPPALVLRSALLAVASPVTVLVAEEYRS